jgi:ATP/maltotriose-dependent transcriptional regulator MalT
LGYLGNLAYLQSDYARARAMCEESLAILRPIGDRWATANTLAWLGNVAHVDGDLNRARLAREESLALAQELRAPMMIVDLQEQLGLLAVEQGDPERAEAYLTAALAASRERQYPIQTALTLRGLSDVARQRGDPTRAETLLRESLALFAAVRPINPYSIAMCLSRLALVQLDRRQTMRATRLLGAAEAVRQTAVDSLLEPEDRPVVEGAIAAARAALDGPTFEAAWAAGAALTLEQAVAEALAAPALDGAGSADDDPAALGDIGSAVATRPEG